MTTMAISGQRTRFWSRLAVLSLTLLLSLTTTSSAQSTIDEIAVLRQNNLDYLDPETVAYYLTAPPEPHNVAILFYAQWCKNCHALAPTWGQIAHHLNAGTVESKLIMGLFDCEADAASSKVCSDAGITHYPTLQYYSLAGQTLTRSAKKQPTHTTNFAGNWQYGDAVLDWLSVCTGLSAWHRAGWGKRLRNLLTGRRNNNDASTKAALPIGIPGGSSVSGGGSAGSTTTAGVGAAASGSSGGGMNDPALQKLVQDLNQQAEQFQDLALRSTLVVDTMLFPVQFAGPAADECAVVNQGNKVYTDLFKYMDVTTVWTSTDPMDQILQTCAMEVGLDYCQRLSTNLAEQWIAGFPDLDAISDAEVEAFTTQLVGQIAAVEPYCGILEDCIMTENADAKCRPNACPFQEDAPCRYLTACFTEQMQTEYAIAMGLMEDPKAAASAGPGAGKPVGAAASASETAGGWGVAA